MDVKLMWEIWVANHSLGFVPLAEAFKGGIIAAQESSELAATDSQQLKDSISLLQRVKSRLASNHFMDSDNLLCSDDINAVIAKLESI